MFVLTDGFCVWFYSFILSPEKFLKQENVFSAAELPFIINPYEKECLRRRAANAFLFTTGSSRVDKSKTCSKELQEIKSKDTRAKAKSCSTQEDKFGQ